VKPMEAFGAMVRDEFGPMRIFRPHRDVRFSKDKTPYKTNAGAYTEGERGTGFYVQLGASGMFAGAGYYQMGADQLLRYRAAFDDANAVAAFEEALASVRAKRLEPSAFETLKTAPRGVAKDHPHIEWLRRKGMHLGREWKTGAWMAKPSAADRVIETWRDARPMTDWLDEYVRPSTATPDW
jgi:uncharacterized protein (TIGR02453 family)